MGGLLKYEYKKIFSRKLVPALLLFLFLFNLLMVYRGSRETTSWFYDRKDLGKVYQSLEGMTALEAEAYLMEQTKLLEAVDIWRQWADGSGEWSEEEKEDFRNRHAEIMTAYADLDIDASYLHYLTNFYSEWELLKDVLKQVSAVAHYQEYLDGIDQKAKRMTMSSLFGDPDSFSYRNIKKTPPVYEHLKGTVLPAEDSQGVLLATESRITDLLLLCYLFILGLSMLIGEREAGLLLLIKPTKRGYLETIGVKLAVMLSLAAVGAGIFYLSTFSMANATLGFGNLERPIQSLDGYLASPYGLTVGQYLAWFFLIKVLTALLFAALLFFLCTVTKNSVSACLAVALVLGTEFLLYLGIDIHSYISPLKVVNLACLADTTWFFSDYWNLNVGGYPVYVVPICLATALVTALVSGGLALWCYEKEKSAEGRENRFLAWLKARRRRSSRRNVRTGLWGKECYKLFVMEGAGLLLVLFALLQWGTYRDYQLPRDSDDNFYHQYIRWAQEVPLTETARKYQEEAARIQELSQEVKAAEKAYQAGELDYEAYDRIKLEWTATSYGMTGFQKAVAQYEYVLSQVRKGEEAELFYTTGWEELLGQRGQREDVANAGKLGFFLAVGLAMLFSVEKSTQMELLQKTCIRGRSSVCLRKYLSAVVYGTVAYILAYLPRYLAVFSQSGTQGMTASLRSLELLSDVPFVVPLWGYLVLVGIARYLGMLAAAGFVLWLSKRLGNAIYTILISLLVLLLPVFLFLMGLTGEVQVTLLPLMTGYSMYRIRISKVIYWIAVLAVGIWFYFQTYEEDEEL